MKDKLKPLLGRRILVTRAKAQASEFVVQIERLGGEACEFPVIETRVPSAPDKIAAIQDALKKASQFHWIIFTSVNGVEYFVYWLRKFDIDISKFAGAKIAAVGPKTAQALIPYGLLPAKVPLEYHAEGLLEQLRNELRPGELVLLPRGDLGREVLPRELEAQGLIPTDIDVYETIMAEGQDKQALELIRSKKIHMLTFTSSSTVTNFLEILKRNGIQDPIKHVADIPIASIGPLTTRTCSESGLTVTIEAEDSTLTSLMTAILNKIK